MHFEDILQNTYQSHKYLFSNDSLTSLNKDFEKTLSQEGLGDMKINTM